MPDGQRSLILSLAFWFLLFGCGKKFGNSGKVNQEDSRTAALQTRLESISRDHMIPTRIMLATGWMESRLNPTSSQVVYPNAGSAVGSPMGFSVGDTAWGLDRLTLGLSQEDTNANLTSQAMAWAKYIQAKLQDADVRLNPNPTSLEDRLRWIWELAQIHRGGTRARSDVRGLFARELIQVLNSGFLWQSTGGDLIRLPPEQSTINISDLPPTYKNLLQLDTSARSDSPHADFLPLVTVVGEDGNLPDHIEIIHCPFSISACLEMQIPREGSNLKLESHYVIAQDRGILPGPVQIARHSQAVRVTDKNGLVRKVSNGIVIMLVGPSGRMNQGVRSEVNPSWITRQQLVDLSRIAEDVCHNISLSSQTTLAACMNIPVGRSPLAGEPIVHSSGSNLVHWGDVPDFDPLIFSAYFNNPGSELAGGVDLVASKVEMKAGESFEIKTSFTDRVRLVVIERMVRCPDQAGIWSKIAESQVRYASAFETRFQIWDAGPNGNGSHFLRTKVYGKDGLIGWDTKQIFTYDYDPEYSSIMEDCRK